MKRSVCAIAVGGILCVLAWSGHAPAPGQTKSADQNKQISDLKKKVSDQTTTINQLNSTITANKASMKDKDSQISTMQKRLTTLENLKKAPYLHTSILKLKKPDDAQVKRVYDTAFTTIARIDGVRGMFIGKPADDTTVESARKDYQLAITILLDDKDALKSYLDDPLYKKFTDKLGDYWETPTVYDILRDVDAEKKNEKKKTASTSDSSGALTPTPSEKTIIDLTNQERHKQNITALTMSADLSRVARAHSENMARQMRMAHNLDGKTPFDRLRAAGYYYANAGENVGEGPPSVTLPELLKAWMDSPLHRKNILTPEFTEIGIGIAADSNGTRYYTQLFGKPR